MDLTTLGALSRLKFPKFQNLVMQAGNAVSGVSPTSLLFESFTDNIVANPGGGQANAVPVIAEINRVITVATPGDSVRLPAAIVDSGVSRQQGLSIMVVNHGVNPLGVFGSGTDTVNDNAAATGVLQMQGSMVIYICTSAGKWYTQGLGEGYSGSFATFSSVDNLTANAAGTQAAATPMTAMLNRFSTVAASGNSGLLPKSVNGMQITTINAGANAMNVFPYVGDQINTAGVNAAFSIPAGKTCEFYCATSGQWHSVLSS